MVSRPAAKSPEIIAIASGKGGTGKTLLGACLGFALARAQHRVLLIDADPGTDGLSLFLLGPKGVQWVSAFEPKNTYRGLLADFARTGEMCFEPRRIERSAKDDHGCAYTALISGKGLYGEIPIDPLGSVVPDLDRATFRRAIIALFDQLRRSAEYDYVIVDTRGGFAFESTDVCAAADSFILVTDPDYTSFHQDRNLVAHISATAKALGTKTLLRAILVNRAVEGEEKSFRLELEKEFPIKYGDTFAIPLDLEALKAYRVQQVPYVKAPASPFAYATLSAFSDILQIVIAQWPRERVDAWNALVHEVSVAIEQRNAEARASAQSAAAGSADLRTLRIRYRMTLGAAAVLVVGLLFLLVASTSASHPAPLPEPSSSNVSVVGSAPPVELAQPPASAEAPIALGQVNVIPPPGTVVGTSGRPMSKRTSPRDVSAPLVPIGARDSDELSGSITPRGSYRPYPGKKTANGQQIFQWTVWLEMQEPFAQTVKRVSYHFNHPSFSQNDFASTTPPTFAASYDGWGCVSSVTASIQLATGVTKTFEFNQCDATN